ncbi:MAG: class I SAM-dependent methyltransferase [Acidimicrobiales bacterium]
MKFEDVHELVGMTPFIAEDNARYLYDLIIEGQLTDVLELGIAHGTATCYIAAALHELGRGCVTAVDLIDVAESFSPTVEEQLAKTGLSQFARVVRMQSGYTWFLHDEIVRNTADGACRQVYDLCIIDGPKNWTIDGAAFFLADKLLRKDGWMIFDDYNWSYSSTGDGRDDTDGISNRSMSEDELRTPQVREIFELLVRQHPDYGNLIVFGKGDWALAQKTLSKEKTYSTVYRESSRDLLAKAATKLYLRAKR